MAYKIFLSYRRDDKELARGIERSLNREFGSDSVFMDVDSIGGGRDWKEDVVRALDDEPIVVALITTRWNSRRGGKWKLLHDDDHVRFELEQALNRSLAIVPVVYEAARFPKEHHIPSRLNALFRFHRVPFSNDRYDYDTRVLVRTVGDLLGHENGGEPPPSVQPAGGTPLPDSSRRFMFTETEEQRKAREESYKHQEELRRKRQATSPAFYRRWEFWLAAVLTVVAGLLALRLSELMIVLTEEFIDDPLPDGPVAAGIILLITWATIRIGAGAAAYWYDPGRGGSVFYSRGLFGGYVLFYNEAEPIGLWGAVPVATVVPLLLSRWVAWIPFHFLDWNYHAVYWIVFIVYTLIVVAWFVTITIDWGIE